MRNLALAPQLNQMEEQKFDPTSLESQKLRIGADFLSISALDAEFDDSKRLRSAIGSDPGISSAEQTADEIHSQITVPLMAASATLNFSAGAKLPEGQLAEANHLHDLAGSYSQAVPDYTDKVIKKAQQEEETRRRWYGICNLLSYILYPVGWLLTLSGSLLEPESKAEIVSGIG